jgi:hypothetical protein
MKMKSSTVLSIFVIATTCPAFASVDGFVETFNGDGEYQTINGRFTGLDNPDWAINGNGELRDGGFEIINDPTAVSEDTESDQLFRSVFGRGSFTERIEIKAPYLGELSDDFPPGAQGRIILWHRLDLRDGQGFSALRMILGESDSTTEEMWGLGLLTGTDQDGYFVPRGPHIALEIRYDDALSRASFSYDNDINDNVPALVFGPYDYTGTFMDEHQANLTFRAVAGGHADGLLDFYSITELTDSEGDFNGNGTLDAEDIDLLSAEVRSGSNEPAYDLNDDQFVDDLDRTVWVETLRKTYFGDSNLDGEFNTTDLVDVFQAGVYEDAIDGNAGWASGDWNGDADFSSRDLVLAFQSGGYEIGPRPAAVPEPSVSLLLLIGIAHGSLSTRRANRWQTGSNHPFGTS